MERFEFKITGGSPAGRQVPMRQSAGPHHRHDHQQPVVTTPAASESVDTLTTTTDSQHTVSAEVVEVEEHDLGSDAESKARETLKLTARSRPAQTQTRPRTARDETKKEIQEDDEATLRELLIRYTPAHTLTILLSTSYLRCFQLIHS
ncbi:hypothetical protein TcasGA2_TC032401 [Tribolium castaneum]|nr:hypothetical protein TcasGA2_TC032401 [Tribolium castaneum]